MIERQLLLLLEIKAHIDQRAEITNGWVMGIKHSLDLLINPSLSENSRKDLGITCVFNNPLHP